MKLKTLGEVGLEGLSFKRPTPLVLLTYLSLEGKKSREHLAELFWQREGKMLTRRQQLNNLSKALSDLHKHAPGVVQSNNTSVWSLATIDVDEFQHAFKTRDFALAARAYTGSFLEGHLSGWSVELEEWMFRQRERLAEQAQEAFLELAEQAARWCPKEAAQHARSALRLAEPQEEMLPRFYSLFSGQDNSLAREVQDLARGCGVTLQNAPEREQVKPKTETGHNLPTKGTSFVGRDLELGDILQQLSQPTCRLLSLVGIGGVGKSRLAIQAAYELLGKQFHDGIYYVVLDTLTTAAFIPGSIAERLELNLTGQSESTDQLARYLGNKHLLLILDNFEHLTDGAILLPKLLRSCLNLKVLVTSRERLQLEEEWVLPVEGLALPGEGTPLEEAQYSDAVQLFVQRAYQAQLTFALTPDDLPHVLKLCRLVAGSPLALELAAVWVKMLSPEILTQEIERNLDMLDANTRDRIKRHKSLRAVFEHSWKLLTSQEQEVLRKLSVFRGGFTKEAAFEVTGSSLGILASLVDKSLLRILPSGRYDRHPLLYQYTQEKLAANASEREQLQAQHFAYFLALAEKAETFSKGSEQNDWLERLEQDYENFRTALAYALSCDTPEKILRLVGELWWFWRVRGHFAEGREWLEKALVQSDSSPTQARAKALKGAGWMAVLQSDYEVANTYLTESLTIYQKLHQPNNIATLLNLLGGNFYHLGDLDTGIKHLEAALTIHKKLGDKDGIAVTLSNLGAFAFVRGEFEKARTFHQKSLQIVQQAKNKRRIANEIVDLGMIARELKEYDSAQDLFQQGLNLSEELGDKHNIAYVLGNLGTLARRKGDYEQARTNYARSLLLWQELGAQMYVAVGLEHFAHLSIQRCEWQRAACLLEAAESLRQKLGVSRPPSEQPEFEQACNELTIHLTKSAFATARNEGRTMTLEQAVSYALTVEAV